MSVIAEYTVPAGDHVLGRATQPGMRVALERLILRGEGFVQYFWATTEHCDAFEAALRESGAITEMRRVDEVDGERLYRGHSDPASRSFTGGIVEHDAGLLAADGDDEWWRFHLAFEDAGAISDFQTFVTDRAEVGVNLENLYNAVEHSRGFEFDLTASQREALRTAFEKGYFDIPRRVTLVDLAGQLGVSDQAVSERLRRAQSKLVRRHLLDVDDRD